MKSLVFALLLSASATFIFAQGEFNVWHFGYGAGVDFNSGSPVSISGGQTAQQEGVASICDAAGNLLLYTDGQTVWNSAHASMPNGFGLDGNNSSSQSALIVPQPGSSNIYYVFTTPISGGAATYSIADMNLAGGLGDITVKNAMLHNSSAEKLTALRHSNGTDYWVVIHESGSNVFMAFLLDNTGLNAVGVSSAVGSVHSGSLIGYMKGSHNSQRLAVALRTPGVIEVFDFDNATGTVSNMISLPGGSTVYGVEFSPDDSKLYNTFSTNNDLFQFDLDAGSVADIISSQTLIPGPSSNNRACLQTGPDGKIYVAQYAQYALGVINFPDSAGLACGYVDNAVALSGECRLGLPNFTNAILVTTVDFDYTNTCFTDTTLFTITYQGVIDSVRWWFGDTASGAANTSSQQQPGHVFTAPGSYLVELVVYSMGNVDTLSNIVDILNAPIVNLGNDTTICPGTTLLLDATFPGASYQWQDGTTDAQYTVVDTGMYWVNLTDLCGTASDSIHVDMPPAISVELGNDTVVCEGEIVEIDATTPSVDYLWQDGSTGPVYFAALPGDYIVEVSNDCQTGTDTLNVAHLPVPIVDLGNDTVLCGQHNLILDAENPGSTYEWYNGANSQMVSVTTTGTYYVAVTNPDGCVGYDTIDVGFDMPPLVNLGPDTTITIGTSLVLDAGPGFTYEWSTGETTQQITIDSAGTYTVIITDENGCTDADHIEVNVISSIGENAIVTGISIYPSLVIDYVTVDFETTSAGKANILVFDLKGRMVFNAFTETSEQQFKIDFSHFPAGMFIVQVGIENGVLMEKVVKAR